MGDHYETLGVSRTAGDEVIRAAYKARIRLTHPDAGGDAGEAQAVNDAYAVLSDSAARANYDRTLPATDNGRPNAAPPVSHAPAASATGGPAVVLAEPGRPPRRWWTRIPVAIATGALIAALTAGVIIASLAADPDEWTQPLIAAAAIASAAALAVFGRSASRNYAALLIAVIPGALAFMNPYVQLFVPWCAVVALTAVVIGKVSRTHEEDAWVNLAVDRFRDTADANPDALSAWMVIAAAPEGRRTSVLLEHLDTGEHASKHVWGSVYEGDCLLLNAHDEAVLTMPGDVLARYVRLERRRSKRARTGPRM